MKNTKLKSSIDYIFNCAASLFVGSILGVLMSLFMLALLTREERKQPLYQKGYESGYINGYGDVIHAIDSITGYDKKWSKHTHDKS